MSLAGRVATTVNGSPARERLQGGADQPAVVLELRRRRHEHEGILELIQPLWRLSVGAPVTWSDHHDVVGPFPVWILKRLGGQVEHKRLAVQPLTH
jgi:hypothetical protein